MSKTIYDLELFEELKLEDGYHIIERVPNGWLNKEKYLGTPCITFVPYSDEFNEKKKEFKKPIIPGDIAKELQEPGMQFSPELIEKYSNDDHILKLDPPLRDYTEAIAKEIAMMEESKMIKWLAETNPDALKRVRDSINKILLDRKIEDEENFDDYEVLIEDVNESCDREIRVYEKGIQIAKFSSSSHYDEPPLARESKESMDNYRKWAIRKAKGER